MYLKRFHIFVVTLWITSLHFLAAQTIPSGYPIFEEAIRRNQLISESADSIKFSFLQGPSLKFPNTSIEKSLSSIELGIVPVRITTFLNSSRPYWFSPQGMIPGKGGQVYISGGVFASHKFFEIDLQPEINLAQNSSYPGSLTLRTISGNGDYPERYGKGTYSRIGMGQSKAVLKLGAFEGGVSTQNIWWGPGQWNALTFSNNAPGFFHVTAGTHRPAKTFFGSFEFQLISGLPKSKKYLAYQSEELNNHHILKPNRNRYLNALTFSIQPKWIKGFSFGATRTVQTFADSVSIKKFIDVFPVFWGVSKEQVGSDLVGKSDKGRDQQITLFFRQVIPKAGMEFYGEFGRRDHALNLRDLIISPAHSRAYLFGLNKVFSVSNTKIFQIRSEIIQQAQSVNWIVRAASTTPWGTNGTIGGFTNWDQFMGPGVGMGANVQMIEIALVENYNKVGLYIERKVNFADFYDTADLWDKGYKPWVDFTAGPILDHQWKNLLLSARMLFTYTNNYYWTQSAGPQFDFPDLNGKFSTSTQLNLIYLFNNK